MTVWSTEVKCYDCGKELTKDDAARTQRKTGGSGNECPTYEKVWVCDSRKQCRARIERLQAGQEFEYAKQRVIDAQKELKIAKTELARLLGKVPKGK